MMRDELLERIASLPEDADIGIQIGGDHLDIAEVIMWGSGFGALRCHSVDLRDVLFEWGLPADVCEQLAPGAGAPSANDTD